VWNKIWLFVAEKSPRMRAFFGFFIACSRIKLHPVNHLVNWRRKLICDLISRDLPQADRNL